MKSIARLLMKISAILGFFGFVSCASHQPLPPGALGKDARLELAERVQASPELAVLFVGNSYSFGIPKAFSKLAWERGKKVRIGHATYSSWTLARHAENPATLRKIREGKWDVIVFQEHSEIPAMSVRRLKHTMFPPLRQLVKEARQHGAIPVLYQTWGRRDGDQGIRGDDFHAMTQRLREGYRAAAEHLGGVVNVPVGDAWEREVSAGVGGGLFLEDGSHPSPLGNQITAAVFFETLYGK